MRILGQGMSAEARRADVEQSDREYIARRQAKEMSLGQALKTAMTATERHTDLMRQGFMKGPKSRTPKKEKPTVACHECENWHREGKHTASPEVRRANRKKLLEKK